MPIRLCCALFALVCSGLTPASARPTEQGFVYQGALRSAGAAFSGVADLRFRLFDAAEAGAQIGPQLERPGITVTESVFSVSLDFGNTAFNGSARFLEIDVRAAGEAGFTTLNPRQRIAPTPIASIAQRPWTIDGSNAYFTGGNLGVGSADPLAPLHVINGALLLDLPTVFQDDLLIEDTDAFLGLVSDGLGTAGSGIAFKEVDSEGVLVDNWTLFRSTASSGSDLRLAYGPSASYVANSLKMRLTTDGDVIASSFQTPPRQRTLVFSALNATPLSNIALHDDTSPYELRPADLFGEASLFLPIDLPEGTQIVDFSMIAKDLNEESEVEIKLVKQEYGEFREILGSATTGFAFQFGSITASKLYGFNDRPVIEPNASYFLWIKMLDVCCGAGGTAFQFARLTYITTTP